MHEGIESIETICDHWEHLSQAVQQSKLLEKPDIADLYQRCLTSDFANQIAYDQGVLALLHACDMAHLESLDQETLRMISLCLADVHFRTGHYQDCWEELLFASELSNVDHNLGPMLREVERLLPYGAQIPTPVTSRLLAES